VKVSVGEVKFNGFGDQAHQIFKLKIPNVEKLNESLGLAFFTSELSSIAIHNKPVG